RYSNVRKQTESSRLPEEHQDSNEVVAGLVRGHVPKLDRTRCSPVQAQLVAYFERNPGPHSFGRFVKTVGQGRYQRDPGWANQRFGQRLRYLHAHAIGGTRTSSVHASSGTLLRRDFGQDERPDRNRQVRRRPNGWSYHPG